MLSTVEVSHVDGRPRHHMNPVVHNTGQREWLEFTLVDEANTLCVTMFLVNIALGRGRWFFIADVLNDIRYDGSTFICCPVRR
jgi:hypothetical protein